MPSPEIPGEVLEKLFQHVVLKVLLREEAIDEALVWALDLSPFPGR